MSGRLALERLAEALEEEARSGYRAHEETLEDLLHGFKHHQFYWLRDALEATRRETLRQVAEMIRGCLGPADRGRRL